MAFATHTYKFTIEFSTIDSETGDMTDYESAVLNVAIKKNFMSQCYPLYVLNLSLTEEERRNLVMNDFYVSLRIRRCAESDDEAEDGDADASAPITDKTIAEILLKPFDKPKTIAIQKTSDDDSEEAADNTQAQKVTYSLNCIPMDQLEYNNTVINDCFSNANLNEIITHELSSAYSGDIYFQKSANTERYESLLIPPMSLIPMLRYLQTNYKVYDESPMSIFFEDSKLYVYCIEDNFNSRDEGNRLTISIQSDPTSNDQTAYKDPMSDEDGNIRMYLDANPMMSITDDVYRNMTGGQMVFSSYDSNYNLVSRAYRPSDITTKTRYYWNADMGSRYEESELREMHKFVTVTLRNMDPTYIEPDTAATITGSDIADLNGEYAVTGSTIFYTTADHKTFTDAIMVMLGKFE